MRDITTPKICYIACIAFGISLLSLHWVFYSEGVAGFFVVMGIICMSLLRWRVPSLGWTVFVDAILCIVLYPWALLIVIFAGMYYRMYFIAVLALLTFDVYIGSAALVVGLCGAFLGLWDKEREQGYKWRDKEAERYYELEALQNDLLIATSRIEQMTVVSERARIAREIHDNAGHEIVAAFISLQATREIIENPDDLPRALRLYDAALGRLDAGMNKIREAVHNLAPITTIGVDTLRAKCEASPINKSLSAGVEFNVFGDTINVPLHLWSVLDACLNEALTNVSRHAKPKSVRVNLDVTQHLVRLYIENDGVIKDAYSTTQSTVRHGKGLRNLRHRMTAVGGSLVIDSKDKFKVVCIIPIKGEKLRKLKT